MYSVWHATMCHTAVNSSILTIKTPSATAVQKSISKDCPVTTKQESPGTGLVVADLLPLFVGATDLQILPFSSFFLSHRWPTISHPLQYNPYRVIRFFFVMFQGWSCKNPQGYPPSVRQGHVPEGPREASPSTRGQGHGERSVGENRAVLAGGGATRPRGRGADGRHHQAAQVRGSLSMVSHHDSHPTVNSVVRTCGMPYLHNYERVWRVY